MHTLQRFKLFWTQKLFILFHNRFSIFCCWNHLYILLNKYFLLSFDCFCWLSQIPIFVNNTQSKSNTEPSHHQIKITVTKCSLFLQSIKILFFELVFLYGMVRLLVKLLMNSWHYLGKVCPQQWKHLSKRRERERCVNFSKIEKCLLKIYYSESRLMSFTQ